MKTPQVTQTKTQVLNTSNNINILISILYSHDDKGLCKLKGAAPIVRRVKRRLLNGKVEDSAGEIWEWDLNRNAKFPQALIVAVA